MDRKWWWKFGFLVVTMVLGAAYVYPTLFVKDPSASKFPIKQKINLGLDLQGGLYMVLGVDFNKVMKDVVDRQGAALQSRLKEKQIQTTNLRVVTTTDGGRVDDPQFILDVDPAQKDAARALAKEEYFILRLASEKPNALQFGLTTEYRAELREKTIDQSIEVIRNRIDEFGVAEPTIASQGLDRIVVELPGLSDVDRAKALIGRTAKLEFKIVDEETMNSKNAAQIVAEIEKEKSLKIPGIPGNEAVTMKFSEYVAAVNAAAKGKIPATSEIAFQRMEGPTGATIGYEPYILISRADVTGDDLSDARVSFNQERGTNQPVVSFSLNPKGAATFGRLTGDNLRKRLAIVLDNVVYSAPVIQAQISEHGQITLGRGNMDQMMKEAKDLSIVLRAGALPAQLEFQEQRVVGPQLGQDSIRKGTMAALIGALLVFLFVIVYYKFSGVIAVFSLILNILFVLAILVGLEATLTLPGIAGIALTVGIAVDSNVLIYERIRDELTAGKSLRAAVELGFDKAFRTILDSNISNGAAAIVLLNFGTGPIKGFAVSLMIGIVTTIFTAVFVCRLLIDAYVKNLESRQSKAFSI